jgi:hypothetical protein
VKGNQKYQRSTRTIAAIVVSIFVLTRCISDQAKKNTAAPASLREQYVGSSACVSCHKTIYDSHIQTAHFHTSEPASDTAIKGSFERDKNMFAFNASVAVAMEKRDSGFYQVEYFKGAEKKARRMDIVVGSGAMGQSFLNWRNNHLFQLPITFFSAANMWSNSPGFPDKVMFNRVITSRCLECHSTFFNITSPAGKEPESFDKAQIIYGVDCEKCHGPAAKHVQFHTAHPADSTGMFIINPAAFSRQQSLDLCALCHSGRLQKTAPSFTYIPGHSLADYFVTDTTAPQPDRIDVHGNQYGLLRASPCFRMSKTMTCNTCHNPHENERGKTALFSQHCMTCHKPEQGTFCKMKTISHAVLAKNCIDCHMPLKPSRAIAVFLPGADVPTSALIRSHFISIYPEETKQIMSFLKRNHSSGIK